MDSTTAKGIKTALDALVSELRQIRKLLEQDKPTQVEKVKTEPLQDPIAKLEEVLGD